MDRPRRRIHDAQRREGSRSLRAAGAATRLDDHEYPGPVGRPDRSGAALGVEYGRECRVLIGSGDVEDAQLPSGSLGCHPVSHAPTCSGYRPDEALPA